MQSIQVHLHTTVFMLFNFVFPNMKLLTQKLLMTFQKNNPKESGFLRIMVGVGRIFEFLLLNF